MLRRPSVATLHRCLGSLGVITAVITAQPADARAQHGGGAAPARPAATAPAEASQFDFLLGQWEVTVTPKVGGLAARLHGAPTLQGTWKAWKAMDGFGIEDELRIVDGSGNPNALSHALRLYDPAQGRWTQVSVDAYRAVMTSATAEWTAGEMRIRSTGRDAEGRPYVQRARFHDIRADGFRYQADRSFDGERTWETAVLRMDARRVAATAPR